MLLVNGKRKENLPKMTKAVEFELLSGFTMENFKTRDEKGNPTLRKNHRYMIPAVYVKFDIALNQNVEYRYAVQEIPIVTGKDAGIKKYTPNRIVFSSTKLIVTPDHPDLYEWLNNSPYIDNGINKNPKFKEVNPIGKAKSTIEREALRNKAMQQIVSEEHGLPEVALRRILSSTGDDGDAYDIDIVKEKLMAIAEVNPSDFLKMIGTRDTELKALINDVKTKKYVAFDSQKSEWQWGERVKEKGNQILSVPRGKNEVDWMIDSLLRDEGLLKIFKTLNNQNPEAKGKSQERMELEAKAKKIRLTQGLHFLDDEKLKAKISVTIDKLKKELDNEKTKPERKSEIEKMFESIGELIVVQS